MRTSILALLFAGAPIITLLAEVRQVQIPVSTESRLGSHFAVDRTSKKWAAVSSAEGVVVLKRSDLSLSDWNFHSLIPGGSRPVDIDSAGGRVFVLSGSKYYGMNHAGGWDLLATLQPENPQPGDGFGSSVALSQGRALIGAPYSDERDSWGNLIEDAGAVYIFTLNFLPHIAVKKIVNPNPGFYGGYFGYSVDFDMDAGHILNGDTLFSHKYGIGIVGAPENNLRANEYAPRGEAFLIYEDVDYRGIHNGWKVHWDSFTNENAFSYGYRVVMDGDTAMVASFDTAANGIPEHSRKLGYVDIYRLGYNLSSIREKELRASLSVENRGGLPGDQRMFGEALAVENGYAVVVSSEVETGAGGSEPGLVNIYERGAVGFKSSWKLSQRFTHNNRGGLHFYDLQPVVSAAIIAEPTYTAVMVGVNNRQTTNEDPEYGTPGYGFRFANVVRDSNFERLGYTGGPWSHTTTFSPTPPPAAPPLEPVELQEIPFSVPFTALVGSGMDSLASTPSGTVGSLIFERTENTQGFSQDGEARLLFLEPDSRVVEEVLPFETLNPRIHPREVALEYDSNGDPHIFTLDVFGISHWKRVNGAWEELQFQERNNNESYINFSVARDSLGNIHVVAYVWNSYVNNSPPSTGSLVYSKLLPDGSWSPRVTIDSGFDNFRDLDGFELNFTGGIYGWGFGNLSIAVDANDQPHVAYCDGVERTFFQNGTEIRTDLRYATNDGTGWTTELINSPDPGYGDAGMGASVAVAPDGSVAIAATWLPRPQTGSAQTAELLYFLKQANGSWNRTLVTNRSDNYTGSGGEKGTGFSPKLVFENSGAPVIVFVDHTTASYPGGTFSQLGQLRMAKRNSPHTGNWSLSTLVSRGDVSAGDFFTFENDLVTTATGVAYTAQSYTYENGISKFITNVDSGEVVNSIAIPEPDISIQTALGETMEDDASLVSLEPVATGSSGVSSFLIQNLGDLVLENISVSIEGPIGHGFSISQSPSAEVNPSDGTFLNVIFSPDAAGEQTVTIVVSSNDPDETPFTFGLKGIGYSPLSLFESAMLDQNPDLSEGDLTPSAEPFGDGVANLLKYAFNMRLDGPDSRMLVPTTGSAGLPSHGIVQEGGASRWVVEYVRRANSGLEYVVSGSSFLTLATFERIDVNEQVTPIDDEWERVVASFEWDPVEVPAYFIRVDVILP